MNTTPEVDPALAPIRGITPHRRTPRLVEWPIKSDDDITNFGIVWARAIRAEARVPRLLEQGLRWVGAGYSVVLLQALSGDGKRPYDLGWHLEPIRSEAAFRAAVARRPASNLAVVTGPGMGPNGEWLCTIEADANKETPWDGSRAEAFDQFADFTGPLPSTPSQESRRGPKIMAKVPDEFGEAFHADLASHRFASHPRVELQLGGWKTEGGVRVRKASSFIAAPSECDGVERVAIDATLAVAELPGPLLARLADFALAAAAERAAEAVERAERRAAGLLDRDDLDDEEQSAWEAFRVETLLADFERLGPAVSGERGHDKTFAAACMIVESGVEDEDEQADLIATFNDDYCDPEWSESQLAHKLRSARVKVGECRDREDRYLGMFRAARRREASGPSRGMWVPSGRTARVG